MPESFAHVFALNGIWIYGPDGYQEEPIPVAGYNQLGQPVRQGYPTLTFTWSFLRQEHMTAITAAYDPENPSMLVTFIPKETGVLAKFTGMMHEPVVGSRQIIYYANVAVKFTHCEPA